MRANSSKRLCMGSGQPDRMSLSQPADIDHGAGDMDNSCQETEENQEMFHGFTQPAQLDNMLVYTQGATQSQSETLLQRLVNRMIRFWVTTDLETTGRELKTRLATLKYTTGEMFHGSWKSSDPVRKMKKGS